MVRLEGFLHWKAPMALGVIGVTSLILCGVGLFLGDTIGWIGIGLFCTTLVGGVLLMVGNVIVWAFQPYEEPNPDRYSTPDSF